MKTWAKRLLWIVLGVATTGAVAWVGLEAAANQAEAKMNAQADAVLKRYPKTQSNAIAQDLNQILVDIGTYPVGAITRAGSTPTSFPPISSEIKSYFEKQQRKPSGSFDPLPPDMQAYLKQHRAALAKAQTLLLKPERPVWGMDVDAMSDPDFILYNFLGVAQLHQLMLLQAVVAEQSNQSAEGENALAAAWNLRQAMAQFPGGKMWDAPIAQRQLSLMRYFKRLSPQWQQRIVEVSKQNQLFDEAKLFALIAYRRNALDIRKDAAGFVRRVDQAFLTDLPPLPASYLRWANADYFGRLTQHYDAIASQNFCVEMAKLSVPQWNALHWFELGTPTIQRATALESEYTRKVLEVKAIATQQGHWPTSLPDAKSKACAGALWQYSVSSEGTMTLTLVNPEPLVEARTNVISDLRPSSYTYSDRLRSFK
jgi:hypothetical protein